MSDASPAMPMPPGRAQRLGTLGICAATAAFGVCSGFALFVLRGQLGPERELSVILLVLLFAAGAALATEFVRGVIEDGVRHFHDRRHGLWVRVVVTIVTTLNFELFVIAFEKLVEEWGEVRHAMPEQLMGGFGGDPLSEVAIAATLLMWLAVALGSALVLGWAILHCEGRRCAQPDARWSRLGVGLVAALGCGLVLPVVVAALGLALLRAGAVLVLLEEFGGWGREAWLALGLLAWLALAAPLAWRWRRRGWRLAAVVLPLVLLGGLVLQPVRESLGRLVLAALFLWALPGVLLGLLAPWLRDVPLLPRPPVYAALGAVALALAWAAASGTWFALIPLALVLLGALVLEETRQQRFGHGWSVAAAALAMSVALLIGLLMNFVLHDASTDIYTALLHPGALEAGEKPAEPKPEPLGETPVQDGGTAEAPGGGAPPGEAPAGGAVTAAEKRDALGAAVWPHGQQPGVFNQVLGAEHGRLDPCAHAPADGVLACHKDPKGYVQQRANGVVKNAQMLAVCLIGASGFWTVLGLMAGWSLLRGGLRAAEEDGSL